MSDQEKKAVPHIEEEKLNDQMVIRREKMQQFADAGVYPFGQKYNWTHHAQDIKDRAEALEKDGTTVSLAGRLMALRRHGKTAFCVLRDISGEVQLYFRKDVVGEASYELFKLLDIGDIVGVEGDVFTTHTGETTVRVVTWTLLSKSLRPLPEKFHGLTDKETRYRQRYLDLIVNPEVKNTFIMRSRIIKGIREYLDARNFLEVETPMLHNIAGGAAARPFTTHMNALDTELYLRIATEIYLKRAVVGGVDRVFEMNRNFRNEGMDSSHSPEFTSLEAYEAYSDYNGMAELTRDLIQQAARDAFDLSEGEEIVRLADGTEYDLSGEWDRIDLYGSTSEALGEEITVETPRETLVKYAERIGLEVDDYAVSGKIVEDIFEELVASKLWAPTFVYDFPEDTSPLTRYHRSRPGLTEKWDLYVRGFETGTAYSELADPVVQRERFEAQALAAANGDPEAMVMDEDFLVAMEQGFPPCGGMGMGIDRLLMVLTGQGIRETIPFPLVKRLG